VEEESFRVRKGIIRYVLPVIFLLVVSLWCRDGGTTRVRITVQADTYTLYLDEKEISSTTIEAWPSGGVGYYQYPKTVSVIPHSQKLKKVVVFDLENGQELFENDFSGHGAGLAQWHSYSPAFSVVRGGLTSGPEQATIFSFHDWTDYSFQADVSNLTGGQFYVRVQDEKNYVGCFVRPFRDFDSRFFWVKDGERVFESNNRTSLLSPLQTARRIADLILHSFPYFMLALLVLYSGLKGIEALFRRIRSHIVWPEFVIRFCSWPGLIKKRHILFLVILLLVCFVWICTVTVVFLEKVPHVQDSTVMLFQAKTLASGYLSVPAPPSREHFDMPGFIHYKNGRMFGQYPLAYPLFLAIGVLLKAPWLMPATAATLLLLLTFFVARQFLSGMWSVLCAVLLFCSPFFQMMAPNFMSHTVGAVFLTASVLFFLKTGAEKEAWSGPIMAGVFWGMLLHSRPLTALAVCASYGLIMGLTFIRSSHKRRLVLRYMVLIGVMVAFVGLFLVSNYYFMDTIFVPTYGKTAQKVTGQHFDANRLAKMMLDLLTMSALFMMVSLGWGNGATMFFIFAHVLPGQKPGKDFVLLPLTVMLVMIAYMFYNWTSVVVMYGPRYVFEVLPLFIIVLVMGANKLVRCGAVVFGRDIKAENDDRTTGPQTGSFLPALVSGGVILVLLMGAGLTLFNWVLPYAQPWPGNVFIPQNVFQLKGFNHVSPVVQKLVHRERISNALVFVGSGDVQGVQWWDYGSVFHENEPTFDGTVVYARDMGMANRNLLRNFPGRTYWRADYQAGTIGPLPDLPDAP